MKIKISALFFLSAFLSSLVTAESRCDLLNPEACMGLGVESLSGSVGLYNSGGGSYISGPDSNPLKLMIEVGTYKEKIYRVRYAWTTARGTASLSDFEELKLNIKHKKPDAEWRMARNRDGGSEIYEDGDIKIALFRYSVIVYSSNLMPREDGALRSDRY